MIWRQVVGQPDAVAVLTASAAVAASMVDGTFSGSASAVPHAWLFTGPPGSGRSVAARAFAAALQCETGEGCGTCAGCRTTMAGTHADVHVVVPEGLSISVAEMRALVQIAARRPTGARWQVVIITDADRLTEGTRQGRRD